MGMKILKSNGLLKHQVSFSTRRSHRFWSVFLFSLITLFFLFFFFFFCKQLESGLSLQCCFYFHGIRGSKLLNGCFVVLPSNLYLGKLNNVQDSKSIFMISDFKIFPIILLRQLNFGVLLV